MDIAERLDKWIYSIFPTWGSRRLAARRRWEMVSDLSGRTRRKLAKAYEAADNDRIRGSKWLTSKLSPASVQEEELEALYDRSEDLYRNDSYASSAINGRVENVVGRGIRLQSRVPVIDGVLDDDQAEDLRMRIEAVHRRWATADRLVYKQRQAERCKAIYGESLVVMSDRGQVDKPVPLTLQVIHPKRLETPPDLEGDEQVRLGIRYDEDGMPVAYYIRRTHPYDTKKVNYEYDEVEAARVCHSFEELFPGQPRGIPWLSAAMGSLKDLKDFKEAHLLSEQIAACFSVFITSETNALDLAEGASSESDANGNRLEEVAPGIIQYLNSGEKINFADPNRPGGTLAPFMEWHLRTVSAASNYPYELLTKDFSKTTYSSGRLSLIDGRQAFQSWQKMSIEDTWSRVYQRFMDELVIVDEIGIARLYSDYRYELSQHQWIPQGFTWIDPESEVEANVKAIQADLSTEAYVLGQLGLDPDEVARQRDKERRQKAERDARLKADFPELEEQMT